MDNNSFTYGFEIEGVFKNDLITALRRKINVKTRQDGSVQDDTIFNRHKLNEKDFVDNCQEINVGIFKNRTGLADCLTMIESQKNHYWDKSCGLHLHIKPKRNIELIQEKVIDLEFLKKIEDFAYTNLCSHIKSRQGNSYCMPYKDLKEARHDFWRGEKYRFVRIHPVYKTMEFRFMSPCEHKCENIKTFIDYFISELKVVKTEKKGMFEFGLKKEVIREDNVFTLDKKKNDVTMKLEYKINERIRGGRFGSRDFEEEEDENEAHDFDWDCDCDVCTDNFNDNHDCCGECSSDSCYDCQRCRESF